MKEHGQDRTAFVVCICNEGYEASLGLHKIYRELPDERTKADRDVRVVDESGEDYIYPAAFFTPIEPPAAAITSLLRAS